MKRETVIKSALNPPVSKTLLNTIVRRLVSKLDVEKVILFGSYVTGMATKDSDVDLFIVVNTKEKGLRRYSLVSELLEPRRIPMDIIVKTPAEVKKRAGLFDPFIKNIYKSGKVLYEKKS